MSKDLEEGKAGRMRYWGVDKCGGGRQPRGDRGEILSQSTTRKKKKKHNQDQSQNQLGISSSEDRKSEPSLSLGAKHELGVGERTASF